MKIVQKVAIVLTATVLGLGLLGSPASADSSWGKGGRIVMGGAID